MNHATINGNVTDKWVYTSKMKDWDKRKVYKAASEGLLYKVRNGVYTPYDALASIMVDIDGFIPKGILCLWSAWNLHGLSTQIPNAYFVAIEAKRKVKVPSYPRFELVYQSEPKLSLGVIEMETGGLLVKVYDVERSVCDAIKHRNKIGIDVMAEILRTYLARPDRNLAKLVDYAYKLRIRTILNKYLEVWQ